MEIALGKKKRQKYRFKKRPYKHQVEAVKKLLSTGYGGALLMEPRTGKTKVVIDYASILHARGYVNRVVVFGPVASMGVWEDQIAENCPYPFRVTMWDRRARRGRVRRGERIRGTLPRFGDDVLDFVIINYDALSTIGAIIPWKIRNPKTGAIEVFNKHPETGQIKRSRTRGGRFEMKKQIIAWQPQMIVLDESHRIKSPTARKSTMIHSLQAIPQYRVIMTGTVVTKKKRIFDIYSQWKFLNPERFKRYTFSGFKTHYGKWTNRNGYPQWLRNMNEDDLHRQIHHDSFSITREECYDLPKETQQIIHVDLAESGVVYDQMAEDMVARIKSGEITEASIKLVQGMRLRQITSGITRTVGTPEHPKGRLVVIGSEKLRAWSDRIEDLMEADEKVVVGALWTGDILRLKRECLHLKIPTFIIRGGMKREDHTAAWKGFAKVSGGAVFIGQPAAASEAIDLSCASIMQWYSLTPSWVNFRQFSDRIALSERPTFQEFFLARGTVDELLYENLKEDGDVGKMMITSPERLLRITRDRE
jgi:SNF2 family DNA or RNA helicase